MILVIIRPDLDIPVAHGEKVPQRDGIPLDGDDRPGVTVEPRCQFIHWIRHLPVHVDHYTVLQTGQKSGGHQWFALKRRETDQLRFVRLLRMLQVQQKLLDRSLETPRVPPLDRAVGRPREELRVGLGRDPVRLVRRISLCVAGRLRRRERNEGSVTRDYDSANEIFGRQLRRTSPKVARPRYARGVSRNARKSTDP